MSQEKPQTSPSEEFLRNITSRVDTAFSGQNAHETATTYLSDLRSRMKDIRDAGGRTVALLLLTAATFELLNRASISNVQLGPIQVKDLSLIQKARFQSCSGISYTSRLHWAFAICIAGL